MNNLKLNENMQFVMMETTAFEEIINQVIATVKTKMKAQPSDWIHEADAKKILGVSSKSTMQIFRNEDRIRYAMVTNKNIACATSPQLPPKSRT